MLVLCVLLTGTKLANADDFIRRLTSGARTTYECMREGIRSAPAPKLSVGAYYASSRTYDYGESGYGNGEYISGNINARSGSKGVEGYLQLDSGREVSFEGEWVGNG